MGSFGSRLLIEALNPPVLPGPSLGPKKGIMENEMKTTFWGAGFEGSQLPKQ